MSEGKPITTIALLPLCYESNTGQFLLPGHFVAPVPPRFINFLGSEIRAKVFDGGIVRTEGRPGMTAGLSFWNLLNRARFEWKRGRAFQPAAPSPKLCRVGCTFHDPQARSFAGLLV
jgi:hypothetical protein